MCVYACVCVCVLFDVSTAAHSVLDCIDVEPAPFQIPDLTNMSLLHYLFAICMYSRMYVTRQGRLVGIVFKGDFLDEKWLHGGGEGEGDAGTDSNAASSHHFSSPT